MTKQNYKLNIILLSIMVLIAIGCETAKVEDENTTEAIRSAIQPAEVLIPKTNIIHLLYPVDGQTVSRDSKIEFEWVKPADAAYTAVLLLSEVPTWRESDPKRGFQDLQNNCLGGASHLAGDLFSSRLQLTSNKTTSEFGICDLSSNNGLISPTATRKSLEYLSLQDDFKSLNQIFWVIIAYDEHFQIISSSVVYELNLEN